MVVLVAMRAMHAMRMCAIPGIDAVDAIHAIHAICVRVRLQVRVREGVRALARAENEGS